MRPIYDLASVFADQIRTAESESARMYEPVIAIVTDNQDPQKLGRVKVKIPNLSADDSTYWAPIIMLGAGKNRGWFFIPEVQDEVLVMFQEGDINYPLVVGAFWNGKDKPPDNNKPGSNPRRVIKSREGSKITFDDDAGKEKIVIEDGKGVGKITIDSVANKITIEAMQGDVCFQAPAGTLQIVAGSATFKAGTSFELHSAAPMSLTSGGGGNLAGSSTTIMGGKINLNCGAAAAPSVSGSPQTIPDPYGS